MPSQLFIFFVILVFYLSSIGKQIFEYDSSGEVFIIINKSVYTYSRKGDEFSKSLLKDYRIESGFLKKKLILKILMENRIVILKYNIRFVVKSSVYKLKNDLEVVLNNNNFSENGDRNID